MKKIRKPRNLIDRPCCRLDLTYGYPRIGMDGMFNLRDVKKAYAWLGRVIKYLEQRNRS